MERSIYEFVTYLREVKEASPNTIQAYQNDLKKLQLYLEKQDITTVTKISETGLNSYVLNLEKEGFSPASVSRNISSIKAFFLYLIKQGKIHKDPSERLKPPKVRRIAPEIMDVDEMELLLRQPDRKTPKGIRDRAMLELLYATGIKVTELITLKLSDINLKMKYITCEGKNERNIPFGRPAKEALEGYLAIRQEAFNKQDCDILFLNTLGEQLSRQGFWKIIKGYAEAAGIEGVNPNRIRQTFAIHLLDNGADLESVREFLGHNDIMSTQQYLAKNHKNSREVYQKTHPRA
ncbi:MAG: site-specific tyrosine recombinase XerD [Lachnospiraceae bacterium]|jgi:integrase/recombinase XerD|nr:site-specific tyrosine recombinase XerD [Lachnospiraceae bacterium]